ncbi:MAG: mechanosensitive ion channel family protein [Acidimicrobiia bacterium]|nr:mechanosensitive ion channel family protein [Acidimicrobiia bacterium]MDH5236005.1 mechanosensitive ion channel family protein [Acidimicrobiia bacterium]
MADLIPPVTAAMILADVSTSAWVGSAAVGVASIVVILVLTRVIHTVTRPFGFQDYAVSIITRLVGAGVLAIALIIIFSLLEIRVGPLLGALGITGILLAMALQPVLGNLVAAVLLHTRRPVRRGDQISSNGQWGTVIDINSRAVVVQTFDGEIVHVPNLKVLDEPLLNQTADEFRRTVLPFQVAYDTDLRHAQRSLVRAIKAVDALGDGFPADVLVTGFGDSGVDLVARFWHPSEELSARHAISEVAITIRETLAAEHIAIPFPQRVVHMRPAPTETGIDDRSDVRP